MSKNLRGLIIGVFICFLLFLLSLSLESQAFAGNLMYTSGNGFFATSERHLNRANNLSRHGNWGALESLVNLGLIKIFPQGMPVRVVTYRKGTCRVHFLNSRTIWWAERGALMNKGEEHYVR